MPPRLTAAAAATALLLCAVPARAQNVSLIRAGSGARAAGMADAFVAVSDDGTAASWNPAGLAQLRQPEFSLVYVLSNRGLSLSALRSPDETVGFSSQAFRQTNASIDFASAAVPFSIAGRPVTLQAGWQRLYQLGAQQVGEVERVPIDPPGPSTFLSREQRLTGDIDVLSAAGAVKLTGRLSLGGSLDFWSGRWKERVALTEETAPARPPSFFTSHSDTRMRGHNFTVGLLLTYPSWNVGLVYHSPFWSSYRLDGAAQSTLGPAEVHLPDARFRLPRAIGFGLAHRLAGGWTVATALTHEQWTDALLDRLPGQPGPVNFFDGAPPSLSSSRDTLSASLGLEHLVVREGAVVPLRIGLGVEPQGGMDPYTRDPVTYFLLGAGAGYNTNRLKVDAAVQYRWDGYRTSDSLTVARAYNGGPPDALGRALSSEWRIKVSVIYRLTDTDGLRALLRKVLG